MNPKLPTGEIEVYIRDMEILGGVNGDLPLQVFGEQEYPEETRLSYRYLDLRREKMQKNMAFDVVASIRRRMWTRASASIKRRSSSIFPRGRARLLGSVTSASGQILCARRRPSSSSS